MRIASLILAGLLLSSCEMRNAGDPGEAAIRIGEAISAAAEKVTGAAEESEPADEAGENAESTESSGCPTAEYSDFDLDDSIPSDAIRVELNGNNASYSGDGILAEDGVLTVRDRGAYLFTGSWNGQIVVRAEADDNVRLIFDGVELSAPMAPVYIRSCKNASITLAEGSVNSVSDTADYTFAEGEDEPDAAIFSKCDLTLNGSGNLTVSGNYACGIRSKDDLKIVDGSLHVSAVTDAVKGKDSLTVRGGTLEIVSGQDALKASNDTDEERGYVILDGGVIDVDAGDDAIHGESWLIVNGGTVRISRCYEGLEAKKVEVYGGDLTINADDDGINAASGSSGEENFGGRKDGWFGERNGQETEPPEKPDGMNGQETEPPEKPDGMNWQGTEPPEKPDGMDWQGTEPPEKPDGTGGQPPELPNDLPEWTMEQPDAGGRGNRPGGDQNGNRGGKGGGFGGGMPQEAPEDGVWIKIAGGTIRVSGRSSDVIDSNGTFEQTGGVLITEASNMTMYGEPDGVLDTNGDLTFTGGTFVSLCRSAGLNYESLFAFPSVSMSMEKNVSRITLTAADGTVLLELAPDSDCGTLFLASERLVIGESYTLMLDDNAVTFTAQEGTQILR